jgi:hypothetical protein
MTRKLFHNMFSFLAGMDNSFLVSLPPPRLHNHSPDSPFSTGKSLTGPEKDCDHWRGGGSGSEVETDRERDINHSLFSVCFPCMIDISLSLSVGLVFNILWTRSYISDNE